MSWIRHAKAILTGASSGLGAAFLEKLSGYGADVHIIIHPRHQMKREERLKQAKSITYCDLADLNAVKKAAQLLVKRVPNANILILCAGTSVYGEVQDVPPHEVQKIMNVNYMSNVILIRNFLPILRKQKQSCIIGIGSGSALLGLRGASAYTASKAALHNFFESLHFECERSPIRVLHVMIGRMDTPFFTKQKTYPSNKTIPTTGRPLNVKQVAAHILNLVEEHEGNVILGRNPRLAYHLRYWSPFLLRKIVRWHGY